MVAMNIQPENASAFFVAYRSHDSLRRDVLQLIANLEGGARESQKDLAARALETAAREVLQVVVADLVNNLDDAGDKTADIRRSLSKLDDHIGSFCKLLASMLSNEKTLPVMRHFKDVLIDIEDANGTPQPWVGFPVESAFATELSAVCRHLRDDSEEYDPVRTMAMVDQLTDAILHEFLEVPKELMKFGFVMHKTANGAIAVIRSVMHGMLHRAIPDLSPSQRNGLADHLDGLILEVRS